LSFQFCPETLFINNVYLKKPTPVIKNAIYGHRQYNRSTCPRGDGYTSSSNCYKDLTDVLNEKCKGQSTCEIKSSNTDYGDPCYGVYKYFEIKYSCQEDIVTNQEGYYLVKNGNSEGRVITNDKINECNEQNPCDLYQCDNNGNCNQSMDIRDYIIYSVGDGMAKSIVKCTNNKCFTVNVELGYYINAIPKADNVLEESLIKCDGTGEITCQVVDSNVNDVYINNDNSNLIKCFSNGCSNYEEAWDDDKQKYFVNSALSNNIYYEKLLIKCNHTDKCKRKMVKRMVSILILISEIIPIHKINLLLVWKKIIPIMVLEEKMILNINVFWKKVK